jgi:hypothetical protein
MQEVNFAVNPQASPKVDSVGRSGTPVIVIDDFGVDPGAVIDFACGPAEYGPDMTSMYPGLRANMPKDFVREVLKNLYKLLFAVFQVPPERGLKAVRAAYSLITTPERDLTPGQCRPHFDTNRRYYLAILYYLNPGPFCGTGLFRHRATGLERVLEKDVATYVQSSEAHAAERGPPKQAYVKGSNDEYELYHRVDYRPNRLVVYPGCLLHSGLVDPEVDINPNPRTGRLTANIFVDFFPLDSLEREG